MRASWVRPLAYALVAVQVVQGARVVHRDFLKSYWAIDYDHGFVRRGLGGASLQALTGPQTEAATIASGYVVAAFAIASLLWLLEALLRRRTTEAGALALLLAVSPFVFDYMARSRRPDQLAVPVLIALGFALRRERAGTVPVCATAGVLFGVVMFAHEVVLLTAVPFACLLVLLFVGRHRALALAVVATPSVLAAAAIVVYGSASADTVAALRADSAHLDLGGTTVFRYLDDTVTSSLTLVWDLPLRVKAASVALGVALCAAHAWWLSRWVGRRHVRAVVHAYRDRLGIAVGALTVVAIVLMFALGIDWVRWWAAIGCSVLIVLSFAVLADYDADRDPRGPVRTQLIVGAYLTALAVLPNSVDASELVRLLVLRQ